MIECFRVAAKFKVWRRFYMVFVQSQHIFNNNNVMALVLGQDTAMLQCLLEYCKSRDEDKEKPGMLGFFRLNDRKYCDSHIFVLHTPSSVIGLGPHPLPRLCLSASALSRGYPHYEAVTFPDIPARADTCCCRGGAVYSRFGARKINAVTFVFNHISFVSVSYPHNHSILRLETDVCFEFLKELIRQPQGEKQVFGIELACRLCDKYPMEN
ncbi:hypothetical protein BC938DRAFT_483352 [Jimgerdemannia flammicorona]|uniref:Uncharacterized protein n=1 Tax=Jimgerdemannia flammicorona TaxID=994334 RepID=A0A433QC20_9FUNG|nr:hypothetical protein BC938DRAFT_483352 [Jimgerdemannia flammicorona]